MKNRNNILTLTLVIALVLTSSVSSSSAQPAQTYNGTLTGGTFYCNG